MATLLKKHKLSHVVLFLILLMLFISFLVACAPSSDSDGLSSGAEASSTSSASEAQSPVEQDSIVSSASEADKPTSSPGESNAPSELSSNSDTKNAAEQITKGLLDSILENAKMGKILDCDYGINYNTDEIVATWGDPDENSFAAHNIYFTYSDKQVVFGLNKGMQIFEVRSYSPILSDITLEDIISVYGNPQHDVKTAEGERVIGYIVSADYRIEFVFPSSDADNTDASPSHYNVLCPELTPNMMADYPGREW